MKTSNKELASIQLNQVIEQLKEIDIGDIVSIYNDYASKNNHEVIYDNDELNINDLFTNPQEAIYSAVRGDYTISDVYLTFNGHSNLVTFNYLEDENCPTDISELAQWLINEDKLLDYDISVTTLDDMLASIEDNITDDKYLLSKLADYLGQSLNSDKVELLKTNDDYYDYLVKQFMLELDDYSYNDLYDLINTVGINYSIN